MKPGRKPADQSRAAEICARLATWRQQSAEQRPSLRALATELGTSQQMLGFHLKGLDRWQQQEYHRKAREILDKGPGMTWADEQQVIVYGRAALNCMLNRTLDGVLERVAAEAKSQGWTKKHIEFVELAAQKGYPAAQQLLQSIPSNLSVKRRERLSPLDAIGKIRRLR